MKNRKLIGFIVAASLAVGTSATFAQNQPADQSGQAGQQQQDQAGQSSQDQQAGQIQQDNQAQQPGAVLNEPAGAATGNFDKKEFIKEAAQGNMAEINMGQLATQKAQDPAIKQFGQTLVTDHSKANDQLKQLAEKEDITLSAEPSSKQQKMLDHLSSLSGAEFDKAFAKHMVQDHKKDIAMYKKAASHAEDPAVSEFAKNTLPTLEEHLRTAQQWVPGEAAGAELQEPSGAEKKSKDANKLDQQNQDQNQQQQNQDQNKSPDSAGQAQPK